MVTAQEIRADFAQRLERRFQGMLAAVEFTCMCKPPRTEDHEKPCPAYYWERACWIVQLELGETEEK